MSYIEAEQKLIEIMNQPGMQIELDGTPCTIVFAAKPYASYGACKTDCFVWVRVNETGEEFPIKISYKSEGAQFVENKLSMERAEEVLGPSWQELIYNAAVDLGEELNNRPVVYFNGAKSGSFTLGWRCDLVTSPQGRLVADIFRATRRAKLEAYSGSNLPDEKRHAFVNGERVEESGVADFYLERNLFDCTPGDSESAQAVLDDLVPINDEYVSSLADVYLALKAVNYRSFEGKYDGNRPLVVFNEWYVNSEGRLANRLLFGDENGGQAPLSFGASYAYDLLAGAMMQLGINTTDDLNETNLDSDVHVYV